MNRPYGYRTSRAGTPRTLMTQKEAEAISRISVASVERRKKTELKRFAQFVARVDRETKKVKDQWGHASVGTFHSKFQDLVRLRRELTVLKVDLEEINFNDAVLRWLRLYVTVCERRKVDPSADIPVLMKKGPVWEIFGFTSEEVFVSKEKK